MTSYGRKNQKVYARLTDKLVSQNSHDLSKKDKLPSQNSNCLSENYELIAETSQGQSKKKISATDQKIKIRQQGHNRND